MRPQGVAIAILNMGVWLQASRGQIQTIRIAVGPAGLVPCRARQAEAVLTGQVVTPELLGEAADRMTSELSFRTSSHRATSQYRHHLAGVLLEKTIRIAFERVGAERES
jgi:CO/xanthine dehydrogenase FAD-binding subunit